VTTDARDHPPDYRATLPVRRAAQRISKTVPQMRRAGPLAQAQGMAQPENTRRYRTGKK
jgi:hypothetical protein